MIKEIINYLVHIISLAFYINRKNNHVCQQDSVIISQNEHDEVMKKRNQFAEVSNSSSTMISRPLPRLYDDRSDCCGCLACYSVCQTNNFTVMNNHINSNKQDTLGRCAIYVKEDEEGFKYPEVDASICVRCYKCINVCPIRIADKSKGVEFEIWGSRKR